MVKRIVLDPGHGGSDPGAVGQRHKEEEDITLKVCEYLQDIIQRKSDNMAFLTRMGDYGVSLKERCRIANHQYHANAFISIHCNASPSTKARGTEVYHYRGSEVSKRFAGLVHDELIAMPLNDWKLLNRGVKEAGFYVLKHTNMPAILIELAFISNQREEDLLDNADFQLKAAAAIYRGLEKFLQ